MVCKNCQNNVKSDFKYCPYCGARIISDFQDHYENLTPPPVLADEAEDAQDPAAAFYAAAQEESEPEFSPEDDPEYYEGYPIYEYEPPHSGNRPEEEKLEPPAAPKAPESDGPAPYFVYYPDEPVQPFAAPQPMEQGPSAHFAQDVPRIDDESSRSAAPPRDGAFERAYEDPYPPVPQYDEPPVLPCYDDSFDTGTQAFSTIPRIDDADDLIASAAYVPPSPEKPENSGPGIGLKLLVVVLVVAAAVITGYFGYQWFLAP